MTRFGAGVTMFWALCLVKRQLGAGAVPRDGNYLPQKHAVFCTLTAQALSSGWREIRSRAVTVKLLAAL